MSGKPSLEEVRKIFEQDRFATENGAVIDEIGERYARCSIVLEPKHYNAVKAVMGGVYFMLADFAFAVASNWEKMDMVSLNSSISYIGAAKGTKLTAQAHCLKNGKSTAFYRIQVHDDLNNLVAEVNTTGYRKG